MDSIRLLRVWRGVAALSITMYVYFILRQQRRNTAVLRLKAISRTFYRNLRRIFFAKIMQALRTILKANIMNLEWKKTNKTNSHLPTSFPMENNEDKLVLYVQLSFSSCCLKHGFRDSAAGANYLQIICNSVWQSSNRIYLGREPGRPTIICPGRMFYTWFWVFATIWRDTNPRRIYCTVHIKQTSIGVWMPESWMCWGEGSSCLIPHSGSLIEMGETLLPVGPF